MERSRPSWTAESSDGDLEGAFEVVDDGKEFARELGQGEPAGVFRIPGGAPAGVLFFRTRSQNLVPRFGEIPLESRHGLLQRFGTITGFLACFGAVTGFVARRGSVLAALGRRLFRFVHARHVGNGIFRR